MSGILRHNAVIKGLPLEADGYVPMMELLKLEEMNKSKATGEDIRRAVMLNNKDRFHIKGSKEQAYVRAN